MLEGMRGGAEGVLAGALDHVGLFHFMFVIRRKKASFEQLRPPIFPPPFPAQSLGASVCRVPQAADTEDLIGYEMKHAHWKEEEEEERR